ncbi:MAG: glycine-rich domain-containing protein, partial [Opitutales bacterium]
MKTDANYNQDELWDNIKAHEIGLGNTEYGFQNRLAYENNWSPKFTLEAIEEYKRFMYLLCRCEHTVTPSRDVDQVWHLHLLYTKDYWLEFVPKLDKTP